MSRNRYLLLIKVRESDKKDPNKWIRFLEILIYVNWHKSYSRVLLKSCVDFFVFLFPSLHGSLSVCIDWYRKKNSRCLWLWLGGITYCTKQKQSNAITTATTTTSTTANNNNNIVAYRRVRFKKRKLKTLCSTTLKIFRQYTCLLQVNIVSYR